ncbi:MAG: PaaI family thioesterase [Pseudomonadota bacterium]
MTESADARELGEVFSLTGAFDSEGTVLSGLPHSREIGMRVHYSGDSQAVLSVDWNEKLIGDPQSGVMHGGVITALLDTACGAAVMAVPEKLDTIATLDLRIAYMRPATKGLRVYCRAECYRLTRSIAFTRAVAFHDDPADPVASASGTFIVERREAKA